VNGGYEFYAHLPGVGLGDSNRVAFGIGELVELNFAEWQTLDWTFPFPDGFDYSNSKPVFFHTSVATLPDAGNPKSRAESFASETDAASDLVRTPHEALLIGTGEPFPDPLLSVAYLRKGESQWEIRLGPFEQEHVIYGHLRPRAVLFDQQIERSRSVLPLLEAWKSPEIDAGLASLKRTALPEFSPMNAFLHNVTFLETLLISDLRAGLTEAFGRRGALLLAETEEEIGSFYGLCRAFYRARSEAMHGDDPSATIARTGVTTERFLGLVRALVGEAMRRLMLFTEWRGEIESAAPALRQELARSWDDGRARTALRASFVNA
jgi:hypothetical protein